MSAARPNVASIPSGVPFLPALVQACLDGSLGPRFDRGERDFSRALFYVPTRRAARALAHAFADALQPRAVLLPRIVPLGDPADLEDSAIIADGEGLAGAEFLLPMPALRRRLILTRLTRAWTESGAARALAIVGDGFTLGRDFADCYALAGELARLIDEVAIEGADWSRLASLVDGPHDTYWHKVMEFLRIAGTAWPDILAEQGLLDAAARQNLLLRAEAQRLRETPPGEIVIAAGSTGTVPATAELLAAIARLPQGAVVLPGLDQEMDDSAWAGVADDDGASGGQPGHPQAALKRLLPRLGVTRADVVRLGAPEAALAVRASVLRAAALPADSTDTWPELRAAEEPRLSHALAGIAVIEAANEREEAAAIAVSLREVLEHPGRTAALITPDRALAERVSIELRRWGVRADDSAGTPLARLPLAALAALLLHAVREDFRPTAMLALLRSPCIAASDDRSLRNAVAAIEIAGFRGGDVAAGLAGIRQAMDGAEARISDRRANRALRRITPDAVAAGRAVLASTVAALSTLADAAGAPGTIGGFAVLHAEALEALAGPRASEGADGRAVATILDALGQEGGDTVVSFADYAAVFSAEVAAAMVPPAEPVQGRIKIWGLLEARLMHADRIVLGGLNEGIWPAQPRQDMLLNRAMRQALGLALPERRIGQNAHDFAMALGAPDCIIARATTVEGTPMVASRFLRRLEAFAGADAANAMKRRGEPYRDAARQLDAATPVPPALRPSPRPPATAQPLTLSITDIAMLERDPYAIYVRDILALEPLEPLESGPDARDRGNIIHKALERFVREADAAWPADPLARLLAIGQEEFRPLMHVESVAAFWWPMFTRAAAWFVEDAAERRAVVSRSIVEAYGKLPIDLPDGAVFTLRGKADLIEVLRDGTLAVTDYKTGRLPTAEEVKTGLQPQLTLTAAMAQAGVLDQTPALPVSALRYISIKASPRVGPIKFAEGDAGLTETAARHLDRLRTAIAALRAGETGYLSRRLPQRTTDVGIYDHLARVQEWQSAGDT